MKRESRARSFGERFAALRRPASALEAAAQVIRRVEATGEPADRVLREFLHKLRISGHDAGETAAAAFAWFRWRGLLERFAPDERGIARALELEGRFMRNPARFEPDTLAAKAVPAWVHREVAVSNEWIRSLQAAPPLWLRARRGRAAELQARLPGVEPAGPAALPEALRYSGKANLYQNSEYNGGLFEIQDVASQAVGHVCAPLPGATWWDACAGEGGKTLHLADLMENRGLIWATDRSARRLQTLKRRAARAGVFNYRAAPWPDPARRPTRTRFDGALVDAPCSGLGTWARNPHARWTTTMDDVRELARIQLQLLVTVAASLKPGGRLVYAVCTLTRSETADVAAAFGRQTTGFEPAAFQNLFDPAAAPAARQFWWPQDTRGNGMFVAAWRRISV
ncbi:MAG: RsmB/NOP family class I SAM-dependent RNA methyltransferase [Opitutaceae bacterium]